MADAGEVFAGITRRPGTRYTALVPNLAGLERARGGRRHRGRDLRGGVGNVQPHATSTRSIDESLADLPRGLRARCAELGMRVRGYLSTAFGCPFEGAVAPARVADIAARLIEHGRVRGRGQRHDRCRPPGAGARGASRPSPRASRVEQHRAALSRHARHGARQRARRARPRDHDLRRFGGRPRADAHMRPAPPGNLATEDLVYMLDGLDIARASTLTRWSRPPGSWSRGSATLCPPDTTRPHARVADR